MDVAACMRSIRLKIIVSYFGLGTTFRAHLAQMPRVPDLQPTAVAATGAARSRSRGHVLAIRSIDGVCSLKHELFIEVYNDFTSIRDC